MSKLGANHLRLIEDLTPWVLTTLRRLLEIDTSFPPGNNYRDFNDCLVDLLEPMGFQFKQVVVPSNLVSTTGEFDQYERCNLVASRLRGEPRCNLYFHTDVVPPGPGWTYEPFTLTQKGSQIFGRGTADMKGAIAAALCALKVAHETNTKLAFDPVMLFCTDEEGGLYPGARYLAEQGHITGPVLCLNGGANARIWAGCFGSIDLRIKVIGRAAHSGDPVGGINAIEQSVPLLNALLSHQGDVQKRASKLPAPPHFNGLPLTSRLTISAASGGAKGSALPGEFVLIVNRRYAPEENGDAVLSELTNVIDHAMRQSQALQHEIEIVGHLMPVNDPGGPLTTRWQQAMASGFGYSMEEFEKYGSSTSSDMGWVQKATRSEIALGGLSRPGANAHAADEFTTVEDLIALTHSLLHYLTPD